MIDEKENVVELSRLIGLAAEGVTLEQVVFAHISDLHFGAPGSRRTKELLKLGRASHKLELSGDLPNAFRDAADDAELDDEENLHILISGDLTSGGAGLELDHVNHYIHERWEVGPDDPGLVGLGIKPDRLLSIAGNHDHWDDHTWPNVPAFTETIYGLHFKETPWMQTWSSPQGKLRLELFGVDSASGLEGDGYNRRARGAISHKEARLLEQSLTLSDQALIHPGTVRVRAIVCHHSLAFNFGEHSRPFKYYATLGANSLDDYSIERLLEIANRHSVCTILTGHIHRFLKPFEHLRPARLLSLTSKKWVWELTCTTTLQDPASDNEPNGFWVHRVRLVDGHPEWVPIQYVWIPAESRFQRHLEYNPLRPLEFSVQGTSVAAGS